ncbi:trypsin-7-like [Agrilus planipennis]|uniref:Trypsin-7-like n=1 Tax=Agrilus planipennis TaxID=224129 RepID=A0A1W4WRQ1_AGRPL|nr:trypsin-7-like [Agrilus planipennis]
MELKGLFLTRLLSFTIGLSTMVTAYRYPSANSKVTGGSAADIKDYPYMAQMLLWGEFYCGSAIISNVWIITAAHCTAGTTSFSISVRAGSDWIGNDGISIKVIEKKEHPNFNEKIHDYDLAVVRLAFALTFGSNVAPVELPVWNERVFPGTTATVSGWGSIYHGGPKPNQLHAVDLPIIEPQECKQIYNPREITDRMLCTLYPRGSKDACAGDSGGPLVAKGKLIGVVSWGAGCGFPSLPCVYTCIPPLRSYIFATTGV